MSGPLSAVKFVVFLLCTWSFGCYAYDSAFSVCYLVTPEKVFVTNCFMTNHNSDDPNSAEAQAMRRCMSWALRISSNQSTILNYDRLTFYDDFDQCQDTHDQLIDGLKPLQLYNIADLLTWLYQR